MAELLLVLIFLVAVYLAFRKFVKTGGCGCGSDNCSTREDQYPKD